MRCKGGGAGGRSGNRPGLVSLPSFRARYVNRNENKVITFIFKSIIQNIWLLLLLNLVDENICENYFFFLSDRVGQFGSSSKKSCCKLKVRFGLVSENDV